MGKKLKVGKQRRDKYYRMAKEAGLRSRAVFKLSQLNRKFEFLQDSQVLVDLCAAPGGWLQVASKHMPASSLIIGVDLVSIKSMPNVITIQNDITTDSCRQEVKGCLQTWLADCVLNDGAPNVGKNWGHDAFTQAQLVLSALRLATEVLKRGGWFVTKIFRSPDHPALIEVFKKLFKKVFVTKPEASRSESSEIYAVCRYYLKPDKMEPGFLDPKNVFANANLEPEKPKINLFKPEKRSKKAEGYAENDRTLHHSYPVLDFISGDKHLEILADAHELRLTGTENEPFAGHPATSDEVRACLKDIKVLGRKELRLVLNWRKTMRQHLQTLKKEQGEKEGENGEEKKEEPEVDEEVELDKFVDELKTEEKRVEKRKRKKQMCEKRKLKQKLDLKMVIPGDMPDVADEAELFTLRKLKNTKEKPMCEMDVGNLSSASDDENDMEINLDSEPESDLDFDEIGDLPDTTVENELAVDQDSGNKSRTQAWFEKDIFNDLVGDEDEDLDIERTVSGRKRKADNSNKNEEPSKKKVVKFDDDIDHFSSDDEKDTDDDDANNASSIDKKTASDDHDGFEVVSQDDPKFAGVNKKLDATEMAMAEIWLHSTKTRRDLVESAYNRYTNNDENLPDWFVTDERRHYRPNLPVTKEAVDAYKAKMKEINARPIKKVAEAKARLKKRGQRRAEKAKFRAEAVIENSDMTDSQKAQEVRKIYKQSMAPKKGGKGDALTYVVAKKGQMGKRARRPAGVQGRFKVVDQRLKKDLQAQRRVADKKRGKRAPKPGRRNTGKNNTGKSKSKPKAKSKSRGKKKSR